ncbi:MAG: hypothetical protein JO329_16220 [Planctomycetaceae bacterium]|nr:hypothetical protein [Planctomycetaceae bacterium]MBV8270572.1 hypothetical protein [Planctomycetaceae bacterium]MBV8611356.1 hypothetical protein [Singulisphaera sp.]
MCQILNARLRCRVESSLGTDQLDIDRRVCGPLLYRFGRCPCILDPPRTVAWGCSSVTVWDTSARIISMGYRIVPVVPDLVPHGLGHGPATRLLRYQG